VPKLRRKMIAWNMTRHFLVRDTPSVGVVAGAVAVVAVVIGGDGGVFRHRGWGKSVRNVLISWSDRTGRTQRIPASETNALILKWSIAEIVVADVVAVAEDGLPTPVVRFSVSRELDHDEGAKEEACHQSVGRDGDSVENFARNVVSADGGVVCECCRCCQSC
jgi:hypothetical protein